MNIFELIIELHNNKVFMMACVFGVVGQAEVFVLLTVVVGVGDR